MTKLIDSLKARKAAASEGGFSLIDVVVTVAIIVALSVGGFIAYNGIVDNAKNGAAAGAADQLITAITVNENDTITATTAASAISEYVDSVSAGNTVSVTPYVTDGATTGVSVTLNGKTKTAGDVSGTAGTAVTKPVTP